MRAGAYALSLLATPLNANVIMALAAGPMSLVDLRKAAGSPPQTTMRGHLRTLTELGVLERRREPGFPGTVDYDLGRAGRELHEVALILERWLSKAPEGPLTLGSSAGKSATKALVEGWSSTLIRALASRPLSLTELNRLITNLNYPSLERRLGSMRLAGLIRPCATRSRSTPYVVTEWLRMAAAPLAGAALWERRSSPGVGVPAARIDIEAAFLLALPMLQLPEELTGTVRFAVETRRSDGGRDLAGVVMRVEDGRVRSCVARLKGSADAWAVGSIGVWLEAVLHHDVEMLEIGGDRELVLTALDQLHGAVASLRLRS